MKFTALRKFSSVVLFGLLTLSIAGCYYHDRDYRDGYYDRYGRYHSYDGRDYRYDQSGRRYDRYDQWRNRYGRYRYDRSDYWRDG